MRNAITTAELFDVVANTSENAAQAGKDDVRMDSLPAARLYTAIPRRISMSVDEQSMAGMHSGDHRFGHLFATGQDCADSFANACDVGRSIRRAPTTGAPVAPIGLETTSTGLNPVAMSLKNTGINPLDNLGVKCGHWLLALETGKRPLGAKRQRRWEANQLLSPAQQISSSDR